VTTSHEPSRIQITPSHPSSVTCAAEKVALDERRSTSTDTGASGKASSQNGSATASSTNDWISEKRLKRRPPSGIASSSAA